MVVALGGMVAAQRVAAGRHCKSAPTISAAPSSPLKKIPITKAA
jgi:hypothetical protein